MTYGRSPNDCTGRVAIVLGPRRLLIPQGLFVLYGVLSREQNRPRLWEALLMEAYRLRLVVARGKLQFGCIFDGSSDG